MAYIHLDFDKQPRTEPLFLDKKEAEILVEIIGEYLDSFSESQGKKNPTYLAGLELNNRVRKAFGMIPFIRSF